MCNMNWNSRLTTLYTGAVHDVLRDMGQENFILPKNILALNPGQKLCGEVFTVNGETADNLDGHQTLIEWTNLLSKAPEGKVIICQPNNDQVALMGELSAETLKKKKVLGYIVDGGCRDTELILNLDFPVFCSFKTPADIVGRWIPKQLGESINIGKVIVHTGDYVVADRDGIVIIPGQLIKETVEKTETMISTENKVRTAIMNGADPKEAYLKFGKF